MDVNNPNLESFQKAFKEALLKRIAQEDEKIAKLKKEKALKRSERMQLTQKLHDAQKELSADEEKLLQIDSELEKVKESRIITEKENARYAKELEIEMKSYKELESKRDQLQMKLNKILEMQIILEARRIQVGGDLSASNTTTTKTETEFNELQKQKQAQDLYLEMLTNEMERLQQKLVQYEEQITATKARTEELDRTVKSAEAEMAKLSTEKKDLIQKWQSSVHNIAKRDQAIATMSEAYDAQKLELKRVHAEISGTKEEIAELQRDHEKLTAVEQRMERISQDTKNHIKQTDEMISEVKEDLNKAFKAKMATLDTLKVTNDDVKEMEKQLSKELEKMRKLDEECKTVEDQIFLLCQDKTTADKTSNYAAKTIKSLRDIVSDLENKLSEVQNEISKTVQSISEKSENKSNLFKQMNKAAAKNEELNKQLDKVEQTAMKIKAEIDKKQNLINIREQTKSGLLIADEDSSALMHPIERDLKRVNEEIKATTDFCNIAKAKWLETQQKCIFLMEKKGTLTEELDKSNKRIVILQEKSRKAKQQIKSMEEMYDRLKKNNDSKNQYIKRLNAQYHEEEVKYQESLKESEKKEAADHEALEDLRKEIEDMSDTLKSIKLEIEEEKKKLLSADGDVHEWEERVHACKETHGIVTSKRCKEGELENLRAEVHMLQVRSEALDRQIKALIDGMENSVTRREVLVDKASTLATIEKSKNPKQKKTLESKKVGDLKNKLRKLGVTQKELKMAIKERLAKKEDLDRDIRNSDALLAKIKESIQSYEAQTEEQKRLRDTKLALVLQLQTKAKWYKAIKDKRYKLSIRDEERGVQELEVLNKQNCDLKQGLQELQKEFPKFKESLKRMANFIIVDSSHVQ